MSRFVSLQGQVVPAVQAMISPLDRGLLYGDGLFETMRAHGDRVHMLGRHLRRLRDGAEHLRIALPADETIIEAMRELIAANAIELSAVRVTITRGIGGTPTDVSGCDTPTMLITQRPLLHFGEHQPHGERVTVSSIRRTSAASGIAIKSLNYLPSVMAGFDIGAAGAREAIMLTADGFVAEGATSNLFCVVKGALHTPPLSLGILPGITRGRVVELATTLGVLIHETPFPLRFLTAADECFYTNSARGIVPVVSVDGERIGDGETGAVTLRLYEMYHAEAPSEWL